MANGKVYLGDGVYMRPDPQDRLAVVLMVSDGEQDTEIIYMERKVINMFLRYLKAWGLVAVLSQTIDHPPQETENRPGGGGGAEPKDDDVIRW